MVEQIIQEIEQNGHAFVPSLLKSHELLAINQFFEANKNAFRPAMVGAHHKLERVESIRGDFTFWIDPLDPPQVFKDLLSFLNELKQGLNEKLYLGLKEFECHLAYYPPGTFYKKHSDVFETSFTRTLSFVFYLNEKWEKANGGELVLFNDDNEQVKEFVPLPGSFICFLSDEFPHEVKSGNIERRSLTGWMHTKIIY
jgi:SM-20-related protein